MKVAFFTLGCKVNQNETGALEQLFLQNGFTLAAQKETADIYIVNSCTVTSSGDRKSRQWLRKAKRQNPDAVTVLSGCFPQAFPMQAQEIEEADIICGARDRRNILHNVMRFLQEGQRIVEIVPHEKNEAFEELPMERFEGHTRAFIKIEDGCNRQCAYCVIPRARGFVRSRSESSILHELETLAKAGYQEVVLSGINLPSYGRDTGTSLTQLLEKIDQIDGPARIRLGSLEPDLLTDDDIARMAGIRCLCPQFHLALQSGCDATLRRMRRIYNTAQYKAVGDKLRAAIPGAQLTTDVIVGFPGETQKDFEQSVEFVRQMEFLKVHVFSFSRREGTPAYSMPGQLTEAQKLERSRYLQRVADEVRCKVIGAAEDSIDQALLEQPVAKDLYTGYTRAYIPVLVKAPACKQGDLIRVRLGKFDSERNRCFAHVLD